MHICGNHFHYCATSLFKWNSGRHKTQLQKIQKQSYTGFRKLVCIQTRRTSEEAFCFAVQLCRKCMLKEHSECQLHFCILTCTVHCLLSPHIRKYCCRDTKHNNLQWNVYRLYALYACQWLCCSFKMWTVKGGKELAVIKGRGIGVRLCVFFADNTRVASAQEKAVLVSAFYSDHVLFQWINIF